MNSLVIKSKNTITDYCMINGISREDFNVPVIISPSLTDCSKLFKDCITFNQKVIIPNGVIDCTEMFENCKEFNQQVVVPDSVLHCAGMFDGCVSQNRTVHMKKTELSPLSFRDCKLVYNSLCSVFIVENPERIFCDSNETSYAFDGNILSVFNKDGVRDFCKDNLLGYLYFNYPVLINDGVKDITGLLWDMPSFNHNLVIPKSVEVSDYVVNESFKCSLIRE